MKDFSAINPRHSHINHRLERWGRWITQTSKTWRVHPMFAQYRSHAWQWEEPELRIPADPHDHMQIEKMVAALPDKHRTAIRWCYAFPWVPVSRVRQVLGVTRSGLVDMLDDARDMLVNRV